MATLEDLKDVLTSINESITSQGAVLSSILQIQERLEKNSKPKPDTSFLPPPAPEAAPELSAAAQMGQNVGEQIANVFEGLMAIPKNLLAASAALSLAFAGLRGWEVAVIGKIKDSISGFSDAIVSGIKSIKTSILLSFGIDDAGKVIPNSALDDLLKTSIMEKLLKGVSRILVPIKAMGDFIGGVFTGSGGDEATKKAVKFLDMMGDGIGAFAKTVAKILKPIGILFSAYDGVMAFMNKEGDLLDKSVAGIAGFIGDFVGAPLDLIKNILSWATSKLGFESASEILDNFSFEQLINDLINGVYEIVRGAVEWVGTIFTDPTAALTDIWNAYFGQGGLADMMFMPINLAVDWVSKKFGWRDEDAPAFNLRDTIAGWLDGVFNWVGDKLTLLGDELSSKFDEFIEYISTVPDRIKFAAEGMFIDVSAKIEKGFVALGDWIASIPARIKAMALEVLNSISVTNPFTGTEYKLVSDEDVTAAREAVTNRRDETASRLAEIDAEAAKRKADLTARINSSGIYNSVVAAVEESAIVSPNSERLRQEAEVEAMRRLQAQTAVVEEPVREGRQPVVIDAKQTDARTITTVGGSTNTTIITPRSTNDLDYGLPRGVQ